MNKSAKANTNRQNAFCKKLCCVALQAPRGFELSNGVHIADSPWGPWRAPEPSALRGFPVREKVVLPDHYYVKRSVYQDRLGTIIGETHQNFLQACDCPAVASLSNGAKNASLEPFYTKTNLFTKTGSGQT